MVCMNGNLIPSRVYPEPNPDNDFQIPAGVNHYPQVGILLDLLIQIQDLFEIFHPKEKREKEKCNFWLQAEINILKKVCQEQSAFLDSVKPGYFSLIEYG